MTMSNYQKELLNMLEDHGGYSVVESIDKKGYFLWFDFDNNFYVPNFQFDNSGTLYRDYPYLISILNEKNLSQESKINFFLTYIDGETIYELIKYDVSPTYLLNLANAVS